jgi:hypothetical protein
MTFTPACSARSLITTSIPSISGITISVITSAGCSAGESVDAFHAIPRLDHHVTARGQSQARRGADRGVVIND